MTASTLTPAQITWRAGVLKAEDEGRVNDAVLAGLGSDDVTERKIAVRALGRIRDASTRDALLAALDDTDSDVRTAAVFAAAISLSSDALPAIVELRDDPEPLVRANVAHALGLLAGPEQLGSLLELLKDESSDVRTSACFAAARVAKGDGLIDTLIETTVDEDRNVQAASLYALSRLSGRLDALAFSSRFKVREELVRLAKVRSPAIHILIAEGLYSPVAGEQADTLHAIMQETNSPEVLLAILRATSFPGAPTFVFHETTINHTDVRVVHGTLLGLGRMKGEAVNSLLLEFILEDDRDWLRAEAIRSLGKADSRTMLQVANGLSKDRRALIRAAVAETLFGREEPEAATYAKRLYESGGAWVRLQAIPALAAVEQPLGTVFADVLAKADAEERLQIARAAGYRLAMTGRDEADHADAMALLETLWQRATDPDAIELQLAVIDAATQGARTDGAALIRKALESGDLGVRRYAASALKRVFDESAEVTIPERPLSFYEEIVRWADAPRAAVVTVAREGFTPGRLTLSLDTENTPMAAWRFSRLADSGAYDNRRIDPFIPGLRWHSAAAGGDRYAAESWRTEPMFSLFAPGTLAAVGPRGALRGEWMITLRARPNYFGRYAAFGRVIQNLEGVAASVLPIDRVVGVRTYEGTGMEPLPPLESAD